MLPFDREHTTSCLTLIETARLYRTVFEIWPVICQKSPIKKHLQIVPVFGAPVGGGTTVDFREYLWQQNTRVPGLSCGAICMI